MTPERALMLNRRYAWRRMIYRQRHPPVSTVEIEAREKTVEELRKQGAVSFESLTRESSA